MQQKTFSEVVIFAVREEQGVKREARNEKNDFGSNVFDLGDFNAYSSNGGRIDPYRRPAAASDCGCGASGSDFTAAYGRLRRSRPGL